MVKPSSSRKQITYSLTRLVTELMLIAKQIGIKKVVRIINKIEIPSIPI